MFVIWWLNQMIDVEQAIYKRNDFFIDRKNEVLLLSNNICS